VARQHEASTVHKPKLVQQENDIPLCTKPPGNVYISLEKKIPVIREKLSGNSFEVILFDQTSDFFTKPFPSRVMFNYLVNGRGRRKVMSIEEVKTYRSLKSSAEQNQIYSVDFMCFSVPGYLLLLYNYKLKIYSYRTIQPRY